MGSDSMPRKAKESKYNSSYDSMYYMLYSPSKPWVEEKQKCVFTPKYKPSQIYDGKPCSLCGDTMWVYGTHIIEPDGCIVGFKCFGCDDVVLWTEEWEEDYGLSEEKEKC